MKALITLGHPAHFHFFKEFFHLFAKKGNDFLIVASWKDILVELLEESGFPFRLISRKLESESLLDKAKKIVGSSILLNRIVGEYQPDVMSGCLSQMGVVGILRRIPTLFWGEDDFHATYLQGIITYPFVSHIVAPEVTNVSLFNYKKIAYNGIQKLAYLHPAYFSPRREIADRYVNINEKFALIRLSRLSAYHDRGRTGINDDVLENLIHILHKYARVYISSERDIPREFTKYLLKIDVIDIHHVLHFAELFIGDSQTMTAEAALLGTPAIRFNDFVGKLNYLEELESKYGLSIGIPTSQSSRLLQVANEWISRADLKMEWHSRRKRILEDKIDVTAFMVWLIAHYPESIKQVKAEHFNWDQFK